MVSLHREFITPQTVSPFPPPSSLPDGPTVDAHGTILIHGRRGTNVDIIQSKIQLDTWAFDIGT